MKVRFLSRQEPQTGRPEGDPVYEEGETYDLRDDQARKWVNRNVAVFVKDGEKPKSEPTPEPTPEPKPQRALKPGSTPPAKQAETRAAPDAMKTSDIKPDSYEDMLRDDLLALAEERGVDLPSGYVSKETLIELLRASGK